MIAFLLHKKFWLPIMLVFLMALILEGIFRTGIYNGLLNPQSMLGNSFKLINSIDTFGKDQVNWITIGDSKTDSGIDHEKVYQAQLKGGINHVKLSLPGSNFMALQATTEWSLEHLQNLQGVMLGMYELEFVGVNSLRREIKISWPFKSYLDFDKLNYFKNYNKFKLFIRRSAVFNYFPDLRDLLMDPIERYNSLEDTDESWADTLFFRKKMAGNMCQFDLENLSKCVEFALKYKNAPTIPEGFNLPFKRCSQASSIKRVQQQRWKTRAINIDPFVQQWSYLIEKVLSEDKAFTLLLLPEHSLFEYVGKPSNASQLVIQLKQKFQSRSKFKVIDLRGLFKYKQECMYYSDSLHFNPEGSEIVTKALLNAL